jgi:hypothetical protein
MLLPNESVLRIRYLKIKGRNQADESTLGPILETSSLLRYSHTFLMDKAGTKKH